jgi:hypothetical protein
MICLEKLTSNIAMTNFNSKNTQITYFHLPEAFSIIVHFLPLLLYILPISQKRKF